ncbi:hypothetical protein [Vibrio diabolicus]|uniref:hypothetical protein n=1 Tax=Vibrio diabolicus TaxID=50719 RepID=UPI0021600C02|nr:hypothetical protein [Vibrio diabolicus]MCS0433781.1 hypothetical protein [Vibrio diabolicus]
MKASTVEILSMLGSWFSGIGAFSAVFYAMNVNRPKLKAKVSKIIFGDDGEFSIDVYNLKPVTAHISHVRLIRSSLVNIKKQQPNKFSTNSLFVDETCRQSERLDIEVQSGGYHRFNFSAKSILDAYCELSDIKEPVGMQRMIKAKVAVYLSNGSVCYVPLPKSIYQKLKNVMLLPIHRRVEAFCQKDVTFRFPPDYTVEHKQEICKRMLDEYEKALRRHSYLELPIGINTQHFWANE